MPLREIQRHRWSSFLDGFSRAHAGCTCTLEVDSSVAGPEIEALHWPFQGFALETGHGVPCVQVFLGRGCERHIGHSIAEPRHIWLDETEEGARLGLRIDADEGSIYLRFGTPQAVAYDETYLP
jgi:hypothetical protein